MSAFGLNGSNCSAAFGLGRRDGHHSHATYQLSSFTAPAARWPSASDGTTALVASLLVSLWQIRPQLLGSLGFARPQGPCGLAAYQFWALRHELFINLWLRLDSTAIGASLLVSLQPLRPKLLGSLGIGRPHGRMASLLVRLRTIRPSYTTIFGVDQPWGLRGLVHY